MNKWTVKFEFVFYFYFFSHSVGFLYCSMLIYYCFFFCFVFFIHVVLQLSTCRVWWSYDTIGHSKYRDVCFVNPEYDPLP